MSGLIQIAGVKDLADAWNILAAGVNLVGFPLGLSVHPQDISCDQAATIIDKLHLGGSAVVITYLQKADEISKLCRRIGVSKVQLHGEPPVPQIERLRSKDASLFLIKSLIVRDGNLPELIDRMNQYAPFVDAFITDSFDPSTGACGATGKTHDWSISRRLVESSPRPVILAGGLTSANVKQAVLRVGPAGVDVHTGVEAPDGRKDPLLLNSFVTAAKRAFAALRKNQFASSTQDRIPGKKVS